MIGLKNATFCGATLFAALLTGHLMQSSPVAELRYPAKAQGEARDVNQVPAATSATGDLDSGITDMELTSVAFTSASVKSVVSPGPDQDKIVSRRAFTAGARDKLLSSADEHLVEARFASTGSPADAPCDVSMTARPLAAAMVQLDLTAECEPDTPVTLHHNGMMISQITDSKGNLTLQMPALSRMAVFLADFESGKSVMARAEITSLDIYDRVVVQWEGPGNIQIHAFEFGADYADEGHVWEAAPRNMEDAALGRGGFLTKHGKPLPDQDLRAQVYTFPSATVSRTGDVVLTIETEVTAETCSRRIEAQTLQVSGGGALSVTDLTLDMPACDAIGDFLVLKNLLQDLKIAQN